MTTAKEIFDIVQAGIESDPVPAILLAYLKAHDGKKLTKRDLTKLEALGVPNARFRSIAGMTSIEWGPYNEHHSMLITYGPMVVDAEAIEHKFNVCHFAAREERNALRATVTLDLAIRCADTIDRLNAAKAKLASLLEYGEPLYSAKYEIEKLVSK